MKYEDLNTKSKDELVKTLMDLKKDQMEMRFKASAGQVEKTHEMRAIRRDIARVQTALNAPVTEVKAKPAAKKKTTTKKSEEKAA